ncbi:MAG: alkaline phosphatase D family protein [Bacteroidia bacterium]|nr:alkaline phosphatase D family protein [Bacteroidia bacterium]
MRFLVVIGTLVWAQSLQTAFVGGVTSTSAQLQVLGPGGASVTAECSSSPMFSGAQSQSFTLSGEGFGRVAFTGLTPTTRYYWRVYRAGIDTLRGSFRTFPTDTARLYLKFAFGSCQAFGYTAPSSEPIFQVMAQDSPWLFLQCGDWGYPDLRHDRLPQDSTTFAQWWDTIVASYYARYQGADIQQIFRICPVDYIYDDHDYINDNASGTTMPHISDTLIREFRFPPHARRNVIRAYAEFFPHYALPDTSQGIYHRIRLGNVEIFMCDNRSSRSPDLNAIQWRGDTGFFITPPGHTMLGSAQLQWLLDGLRTSTATWKFVVTGVAFNRGYRQMLQALSGNYTIQRQCALPGLGNGAMLLAGLTDTWASFAAEQDSILSYCRRHGIRNVIWLSSDSHTSAIDDGTNAGFPELMAGNLRQRNSQLAWLMDNAGSLLPAFCPQANLSQNFSVWNAGGQGLGNSNFNDAYGKVEVFGDDSVRLSIIDVNGTRIASLTLRSGQAAALYPTHSLPAERLRLYPSPAQKEVFVEIDPSLIEKPTPLYLTDALGKVLERRTAKPGREIKMHFSLESLPAGLYYIVVWTEKAPYVRSFLKE